MRGLAGRRSKPIVAGLVLAISVVFFVPQALAAEEDVTADHDADWHMRRSACDGSSSGEQAFVPGPVGVPGDASDETPGDSPTGGPPLGTGSLRFDLGENDGSIEENRNSRYSGRLLADLQELTYWTYVQAMVPPPDEMEALYMGLSVDTNNDNIADDTLLFEPSNQDEAGGQHGVTPGTWQQWIAKDVGTTGIEGLWFRMSVGETTLKSIEGWVQDIPALKIVNPATLSGVDDPDRNGGLFVGAGGCGNGEWDGFVGHLDEVSVTFTGSFLEYDFDPEVPGRATRLDCSPEDDLKPAGRPHTITCTATNSQGQRVSDVEIDVEAAGANDTDGFVPNPPDFSCTTRMDSATTPGTNEAGTCSITHGSGGRGFTSNRGITTYTAWIDDDDDDQTTEADRNEGQDEGSDPGPRPEVDDTDVMTVEWVPILDCAPETIALQINSSNTITCTVRDAANNSSADVNVDFEMIGPNDIENPTVASYISPDMTCTTNSSGICSVTHGPGGTGSTSSTGRTTYRAWIDLDNSNNTFEVDQSEGRAETSAPGSVPEADFTDVVEANWSTTSATPTPSPTQSRTPTPTPSRSTTPTPSPTGSATPTPRPSSSTTPDPDPTQEPPRCAGSTDAIMGTAGDDVLIGTHGSDVICGFGGDDVVRARRGRDLVKGGSGQDEIHGGRGSDRLRGGSGPDRLYGGPALDRLDGGPGRDRCYGGRPKDDLRRCE